MRATRLSGYLIGFAATLATFGLGFAAIAGPPPPTTFFGFDFNADGKADMARFGASGIRVDILDGTSSIANGTFPNGGGTLVLKAVGLCNNDDNYDLIAQGGGTTRVTFVNASGTGQLGSPLFISDGGGTWQVVDAADVNGDGIAEIIFYGTGSALGAVRIADISTGTPVFSYISTAGGIWTYKFHADVNGDGSQDLVFLGTGAATGTARANLGGTATAKFYAEGGGVWAVSAAGDVNNDNTDDLIDVGSGAASTLTRVTTLNTSGDPTGSGFVSTGGVFTFKAVGDFNNDGNADLGYQGASSFRITPMTGTTAGVALFPPNGGGTFTLRHMSDTNADGFFDLQVTDASNNVRIQTSNGTSSTTNGASIPNGGLVLF